MNKRIIDSMNIVDAVIDKVENRDSEELERDRREEARIENLEYKEECREEDSPAWDQREGDFL